MRLRYIAINIASHIAINIASHIAMPITAPDAIADEDWGRYQVKVRRFKPHTVRSIHSLPLLLTDGHCVKPSSSADLPTSAASSSSASSMQLMPPPSSTSTMVMNGRAVNGDATKHQQGTLR